MTLEDHLGDILRKARQASGTSLEAAASAAGIGPADLSELEQSGATGKRPNLSALGKLVGLSGKKLEGIAAGWLPKPTDLSNWRELRVFTTSGDGLSVNAYLVWDEVTREAAIFDTGFDAEPMFKVMDGEQLQLKHIFITHSHHDHIEALPAIRSHYPKARVHSSSKNAPPDQRNRANDFIHLGSLRITNRDTPGHAEDGVTYIIGNFPEDAPNVAVVGDCIFAGSMGRPNQSGPLLKQKVREQILSLPAATLICPGHGPLTTVGEEIAANPFFE